MGTSRKDRHPWGGATAMHERKTTVLNLFPASLIVLMAIAPTPAATFGPDQPTGADLEAIVSLSNELLERVEAAKTARSARVELESEIKRAQDSLIVADKTATIARIAVDEYLAGSYPQDEQTIQGEIKLAESEVARAQDRLKWSDRMVKRGVVSNAENLQDKLDEQKSQIELTNAKQKLQVLRTFTKNKQVTGLKHEAAKAEADLAAIRETIAKAELSLARSDRSIIEAELTRDEAGVLTALDEAIAKFDAGDVAQAREQLEAATKMWRTAKAARAAARFPSLRKKIHAEADALRAKAK